MSQSVLKLKVDGREFDANIKSAVKGLQGMEQSLKHAGKSFKDASKESIEYVRSLGKMETKSNTVRGKVGELSKAYTELRAQYNRLTAEEKRGDFGKALNKSLEQLRARTIEAKSELNGISKELSGNMSGALSDIAGKFGINSDLMGMLTTGTMAYTAAITAAAAAVAEAAKAWAEYNSELSKQDQITSVTTGLKGNDAKAMTDQVRAIAQTYNVDFREAINAANTLMTQFGLDGQKSLNLLKKGMQGMIQGDGGKMLSMIQQYAPAFRDAGIEADQLVAIIHNTEGGLFTDQNMNAIVMGIKNIRLMKDTTKEAMKSIGIDADDMAKKLNDGTMSVFEALRIVSDAIEETGSGSQAAGEIMNDIFGKQGVAAGTKLGEAIAALNLNLDETSRQTGNVGTAMSELEEATERLNVQMRETFGYEGWEEMEIGLKTKLYNAITNIMIALDKVTDAMGRVNASVSEFLNIDTSNLIAIFDGIATAIAGIISPLLMAIKLTWELIDALSFVPDVEVPSAGGDNGPNLANAGIGAAAAAGGAAKVLKRKAGGGSGYGGGGSGSGRVHTPKVHTPKTSTKGTGTTTKPKTEEDLNNEKIKTLTQEYIKASEDRRKAIQAEIQTLQTRNAEIQQLKEEAQGTALTPKEWAEKLGLADETTISNLKLTSEEIKAISSELQKIELPKTVTDYLMEGPNSVAARIDEIKKKIKDGGLGFAEYERLSEELKNLEAFDLRKAKVTVAQVGDNRGGLEKMIGSKYQGSKEMVNTLGQLGQGLKGMGINLGKGFDETVSFLQSIFTVIEAVQGIISAVEIFTKVNDATQTAILSEIAFNTAMAAAGSFFPLHTGGLVHAANGVFVPGASNGGRDTVRALLSPGELVLNAAQQSNLATQLQANAQQRNDNLGVRVRGEDMYTAIDNYMRRTGKRFTA